MKERFPIVGIGASAGGLEALEQFLGKVPETCGMAFVIIQHLDPAQISIMPELLQRITNMKVVRVSENMELKPDCIYTTPPDRNTSITNGRLHLTEPKEAHGLRLPIDFFFRSLAENQEEKSIGIILSGMGSDGALGLKAIKENGGIAAVQEPKSAKYDSMPRSALEDVNVDIVASASELPMRLFDFIKSVPRTSFLKDIEIRDEAALKEIIDLIHTNIGHDFSLYKKNTIYRRIHRRMNANKIEDMSEYVQFLQENVKEIEQIYKELLIGVTNFFRDSIIWEKLGQNIIPSMLANLKNGQVLRAWIPACSTGEEAYSLAIVFKETLAAVCPHMNITLQIFATDLDAAAIDHARKGIYRKNIAADVSEKRLDRFFEKLGEGYRINNEIREMVVFAQQNVIMDPPFTRLDILLCRNLLIYIENELQKRLISIFHYSLKPGGILVLGNAEAISDTLGRFKSIEGKLKIYKRQESEKTDLFTVFPTSNYNNRHSIEVKAKPVEILDDIKPLVDSLILQQFSPVCVLVNENGDIIYINGKTGDYMELPAGKANWNIITMLREEIRNELPSAFRKAKKQIEPVFVNNIVIQKKGRKHIINIKIKRIEMPEALKGMVMVAFAEVPVTAVIKSSRKIRGNTFSSEQLLEKEAELKMVREEMQILFEEMQTSQEELKSTNEELQSTNEELQSANEELTTSKEEMQSLNEELQTTNVELQRRLDDYSQVNSDMKNLLDSTEIITLFLDKKLNIRRYTKQIVRLFKILESDIGRPITDLASELVYTELQEDALEVLKTLEPVEKNISTRNKSWLRMRIMPYRTYDDKVDGLVVTFIDITQHRLTEKLMRNAVAAGREEIAATHNIEPEEFKNKF